MTICLDMIVKNEAHVIQRCLTSVKNLIDYWVIVDTGSTDGTQQIIKDFLRTTPGELYEKPWINFSHNRNEALKFAKGKGDYLLIIDADDCLIFDQNFQMPVLVKDFYVVVQKDAKQAMDTQCMLLIKNSLSWKWHGVVHEVLGCPEMSCSELLLGVTNQYFQDGSRSKDSEKFQKDTILLEEYLLKNPNNTRTVFYLAESYVGAKNYLMAIRNYERRVLMNGSEEEIFWSLYSIAKLEEALSVDLDLVREHYVRAYQYRPSRIEPIYDLISLYIKKKEIMRAYQLAKNTYATPLAQDAVFVCRWVYEWGIFFQYVICCKALGMKDELEEILPKFLAISTVPNTIKSQFLK
jgi:glycosyltransferase involved in cell wall biosynthesis